MTDAVSNITNLTLTLLSMLIAFNLVIMYMLNKLSKKTVNQEPCVNTQLQSIQQSVARLTQQIEKIVSHTVNIKSNTHQAYQQATDMIQMGNSNEEIMTACKLAKGEIELLRALASSQND